MTQHFAIQNSPPTLEQKVYLSSPYMTIQARPSLLGKDIIKFVSALIKLYGKTSPVNLPSTSQKGSLDPTHNNFIKTASNN